MTVGLKQGLGLVWVVFFAALLFWLMTSPSQRRVAAAQDTQSQLAKDEAELVQRMARIEAANSGNENFPTELLWAGTDDASMEIAQQQALVDLANESGMKILSFGVSQAPEKLGRPAKAYEIEVEGGHAEAARLLSGIEEYQPRLALSYLWVRQIPIMDGQPIAPVNMRLAVWGFSATEQEALP